MFKWIAKKFLLSKVNDLLKTNEANVQKTKGTLTIWIVRIAEILACLKKILSYLDDNKIDTEEVEKGVNDIKAVIDNW